MKTIYKISFGILTILLLALLVYADNASVLYGQNSTGNMNILRTLISPVEF